MGGGGASDHHLIVCANDRTQDWGLPGQKNQPWVRGPHFEPSLGREGARETESTTWVLIQSTCLCMKPP